MRSGSAKNCEALMSKMREGRCQCGNVGYRLLGAPLMIYACHCRDCQKQSSSAFGISLWMNRHDVKFSGSPASLWSTHGGSGAVKICAYCSLCGSRIYHTRKGALAPLSIKAGTLNDTNWLKPVAHIWTKHAQPWLNIEQSELHCFQGEPDDKTLRRIWAEQIYKPTNL